MGRHAGDAPQDGAPRLAEVLGWGAFTTVLVVGALVWSGVPWLVVLAVGATVLAGIGAVAAAMAFAPRNRPVEPQRRSRGSSTDPEDDAPVR